MSVARYDEQPFPYQVEAYHELARGQWVEVRANDVKLPVGARGVVVKRIAETGNYQVAVEVEGEATKRLVALCPDQVRPIEPPLPEPEAAPEPEPAKARQAAGWTEEKRAEQAQRVREMWARKKAERAAAAAAEPEPEKPKRKLAKKPAPDPALMTRHRPEGMDEAIAEAVLGEAMPEPEPPIVTELADAIRELRDYREPYAPSRSGRYLYDVAIANPPQKLAAVTWTKRAADAIRPVLAEAAANGGEVTQLALLVETISYLEDGGRP